MDDISKGIIEDIKTECGWAKSQGKYKTLSYRRWKSLKYRCKEGGKFQQSSPGYIGCENHFKSFDDFVDWSRLQVGYSESNWHLDKDLLVKGNKIYCPERCVFIPKRINTLILKSEASRGSLPIGVTWHKQSNKFMSQCNNGTGKQIYIGMWDNVEDAFLSYKLFKEKLVRDVAEEYKGVVDERVYDRLINYEVNFKD